MTKEVRKEEKIFQKLFQRIEEEEGALKKSGSKQVI
jgi:hypothetical protein